jgi:hypothetical protein
MLTRPLAIAVFIAAMAPLAVAARDEVGPATLLDSLLVDVVKGERVDYELIRQRHMPQLNGILDAMAQVDPASLGEKDRLAFYINLYNATMIKAVVDRGGHAFRPDADDYKVFKDPLVRLKTGNISLNALENEVIRPQFKDARIHAALVCAAVSCPPIIDKAYRGDTLDRQLDENVKRWLADPKRNVIDDKAKTLKLSKIFDWYAADFGGKANVAKWVSEKLGRDVSGYKVEYLEYDWALNKPNEI